MPVVCFRVPDYKEVMLRLEISALENLRWKIEKETISKEEILKDLDFIIQGLESLQKLLKD